MVTGQRRGVLREVVDEGRRPQLGADKLLEEILNDLAVDLIVVNLKAHAIRELQQRLTRSIHRDFLTQGLGGGTVQVDMIPFT